MTGGEGRLRHAGGGTGDWAEGCRLHHTRAPSGLSHQGSSLQARCLRLRQQYRLRARTALVAGRADQEHRRGRDLMVTRCYLCGGRTERREVTAENWWGDARALVVHVPAWVCQRCGEVYFDTDRSR